MKGLIDIDMIVIECNGIKCRLIEYDVNMIRLIANGLNEPDKGMNRNRLDRVIDKSLYD